MVCVCVCVKGKKEKGRGLWLAGLTEVRGGGGWVILRCSPSQVIIALLQLKGSENRKW